MTKPSSQQVFQVWPDHARYPDKWFLDEPLTINGVEIDAREFTEARVYRGPAPAVLPVANPGREVAFHLAAFEMPVVSTTVAEIVQRLATRDVELFPVDVQGAKRSYLILNVVCALDCLDESRSEVTRWREEDGRPDRLGEIHVISTIRVDPVRTGGHHIFRLRDWPHALLVSDTLKSALEDLPDLGVVFEPAS